MTIESGVTLDPIGAEIFFDKSKLEKLLDKGMVKEINDVILIVIFHL